MRARNIKPGFFKNEDLAECSPLARILFSGLWCMADREGRLEYRPKRIKAEILPYDNCKIETLLTELERYKFIFIYSVNDMQYIEIINFRKHQHCHINEGASSIPAPEQHGASMVQIPEQHGSNPSDSPILNTEYPILKPGRKTENGFFDKFWQEYPNKKSKGRAEKAWLKISPDEQLLATIIAKIQQAKTSDQWKKDMGKFIPHPATWLNDKGWLDDYDNNGGKPKAPIVPIKPYDEAEELRKFNEQWNQNHEGEQCTT